MAFRDLAIELARSHSQFAFQKSDAVFNAKAFVIYRFGLARRGSLGLLRGGDESQPERLLAATSAVRLIFV